MAGVCRAVFGIYPSIQAVEGAVDVLRRSGFRNTDISIIFLLGASEAKACESVEASMASQSAVTQASTGAFVRGTLGWLVSSGTLTIPGSGRFLAAGPMMAALGGVAGAADGVTGVLIRMGIPEYESTRYAASLQKGRILLSVQSHDSAWNVHARRVLERTVAGHVSSTGETQGDVPEPQLRRHLEARTRTAEA